MLRVMPNFLVIEVWRITKNIYDSNFQFFNFLNSIIFRSNELFYFLQR